jgi:hypothetical protein
MTSPSRTLAAQAASDARTTSLRDLFAAMPIVMLARAVASAFADSGRASPDSTLPTVQTA